MTIALRQFAETAVEPRDALRAFIADLRVATEEDAFEFLRGERKRLRKYLADLVHEGSIAKNQSGAYVFVRWNALPLHRYPAAFHGTIAFHDDVANAMAAVGRATMLRTADPRSPDPIQSVEPSHASVPVTARQQDLRSANRPTGAPAPSSALTPTAGDRIESSRIDSNPDLSNRLESISRGAGGSARSYIEEKLCLPKLQRLRIEVTGANAHMTRKFAELLRRDPDLLKEWIGEASTPAITEPCRFLNDRMTNHLRTYA